jgi:hypothetical protein
MDLKRAWRNGFLVSLIFAIPLSDQYYNQYSNLFIDDNAAKTRVPHAATGLADAVSDKIADTATSWDNSVDEGSPTIPANYLSNLLLESGDTDISDIRKTAIQFDAQDIFLSERSGDFDLDQNSDVDFGPVASISYGFGNSSAYAPGFSGPFTPSMLAPGGKTASFETQFIDPLAGSSTETDTARAGTGDESLHNVPEPSSFVLMTIGTISVGSLLFRRSKSPTQHY